MNQLTSRQFALILFGVQLPLYVYFWNTALFPLIGVVLGGLSSNQRFRFRMTTDRFIYLCFGVGVLLYIYWTAIPPRGEHFTRFLGPYGLAFAEYFLMIQVLLLLWEQEDGISKLFPLPGGLLLMFLGDKRVDGMEYIAYQSTVLMFVVVTALFARASQLRVHRGTSSIPGVLPMALLLGLVIVASAVSSRILYQYQNELDRAFMNMVTPPDVLGGTRLNREVKLGSITQTKANARTAIALRVVSETSPGYLRGAVYDEYRGARWINSSPGRIKRPEFAEGVRERFNRFRLIEERHPGSNRDDLNTIEIWPSRDIGDMVFTQLNTATAEISVPDIVMDEHGIITARSIKAGQKYYLNSNAIAGELNSVAEVSDMYLQVPEKVDDRVRVLAENLFAGASTSTQKVDHVIAFFHGNYTYNLGVEIPANVDPVTYFVLEQPPGHCELFASSAVILLRLGGVPCRYVTGYFTPNKHPVGDYWVARSGDAHAWVEAWDAETGWFIVETTPSTGMPSPDTDGWARHRMENLKFQWVKLKDALMSGQLIGSLVKWLKGITAFGWNWLRAGGWIVPAIGILLFGAIRWMRRVKREQPKYSDEDAAYRVLLDRMDELLQSRGITRKMGETLLQFSNRLSEQELPEGTSVWYRDYARSRYNPGRNEQEDTAALAIALDVLCAEIQASPSLKE